MGSSPLTQSLGSFSSAESLTSPEEAPTVSVGSAARLVVDVNSLIPKPYSPAQTVLLAGGVVQIGKVLSVRIGTPKCCGNVSDEPYIECVFENDLIGLNSAATLAAAESNERTLITAETRRLEIAAHWADLHPGDAVVESRLPGSEHPVRLGGDGTPTVAGFAPAELGCVLRMSDGSVSRLIGDSLDLRHRLRQTWTATQAGQVPAYQARRIAHATRHLTAEQAALVDQRIAGSLGAVSWGRMELLLEAAILAADPDGAQQAAAAAVQERFVRLGRTSQHGLKLIIARAAAGDAMCFKAIIDRIADILGRQGDSDTVEVRRSKAIGILAQPADALQMLCAHQNDTWDGSTEPDDRDTEPDDRDSEPSEVQTSTGTSLKITAPPFDPNRARPRVVIYVHLAAEALMAGTGICRVEDVGPVVLSQLRTLLGTRCTINLKPVIDLPAGHIPIDSYEIPASLREQLLLRYPADVFPYAAAVSRRIDADHTSPYLSPDRGGPPGQTRIGNLGPYVRHNHNRKTHGRWQVRQPEPGTWLWRSPRGRIYLVNSSGTHPLGDSAYAQTIWHAADASTPALVS